MSSSIDEYRRCLPAPYRERAGRMPEASWWPWRGHRIHIARAVNPSAPARLLVVHGAGGHSGALWPVAALAADLGFEVLAPDLPGYGRTEVVDPAGVRYSDWLDCLHELILRETAEDHRPLVLLGASMGGMLAYSALGRLRKDGVTVPVRALVATCLLDPREDRVWSALSPWAGRWGLGVMDRLAPLLDRRRVPIRWLTPMGHIANNPALSRLCCRDPMGGGGRVPLGFLRDFLHSVPPLEPEAFSHIPVLLTHPEADRWTPPALSLPFFERIAAPREYVPLPRGGHFPVEAAALEALSNILRRLLVPA